MEPTLLGNLMPIPDPPSPETQETIAQLLAPYRQSVTTSHLAPRCIHQPRISVTKYRKRPRPHSVHSVVDMRSLNATSSSKSSSEPAASSGYITVYDVPDSCWSLIFHFCAVEDILFHIGATNKFFQSLVIETSTWIHRKVVLPATVYSPSIPKLVEDTLESIFLNWTSLKQLDIMLGTFPLSKSLSIDLTQSESHCLLNY